MPMSRSSMGMHALPRLPVPAATGAEFEYRATSACPPCCAMRTWHPACFLFCPEKQSLVPVYRSHRVFWRVFAALILGGVLLLISLTRSGIALEAAIHYGGLSAVESILDVSSSRGVEVALPLTHSNDPGVALRAIYALSILAKDSHGQERDRITSRMRDVSMSTEFNAIAVMSIGVLRDLQAESASELLERAIRTGSEEAIEIALVSHPDRHAAVAVALQLSHEDVVKSRLGACYAMHRVAVTGPAVDDDRIIMRLRMLLEEDDSSVVRKNAEIALNQIIDGK
jgi:hypothetical protein